MPVSRVDSTRLRRTLREDAETNLMLMLATTSTVTLNQNSPPVISIDPGTSAVNVVMYTPSPAGISPQYTVINRAAATGTLVLKQADGSTTVTTIAVGKVGTIVWDGVIWRGSSLP